MGPGSRSAAGCLCFTGVEDVYYISVDGLARDHPYYAKALAAHKALAVGQKVLARDGVVAKNVAGQRL